MPVEKAPGDRVIGGTLNGTGGLVIRAERVGSDTVLAQIVRMVSEARRTPRADSASGRCRGGLFCAWRCRWSPSSPSWPGAYSGPAADGPRPGQCRRGLDHRLPVCPRAGDADVDHGRHGPRRRAGVLIKNAEALEVLERVDTLVVDKTGTLTEGKPRLASIEPVPGQDEGELLRLAASLEQGSEHPLAAAITQAAREKGLS